MAVGCGRRKSSTALARQPANIENHRSANCTRRRNRQWLVEPLLERHDPLLLRHYQPGGRRPTPPNTSAASSAMAIATSSTCPQMVVVGRAQPRCNVFVLMGQERSVEPRRQSPASMILCRSRPTGNHHLALAAFLRLRRRALRPRRGWCSTTMSRCRSTTSPSGLWPLLRIAAGSAGAGPHPPLHARHRPGRGVAAKMCRPREVAHRLLPSDRRADGDPGGACRGAHRHRAGAAAVLKSAGRRMDKVGIARRWPRSP